MEKKLLESKKENSEEAVEYFEFIKSSVEDKSYFKDGLDWYFFRYLKPICDRTLLIFGSIISLFVLYCLVEMIRGSFPLVEKNPIFVTSKDTSLYFPNLILLKPRSESDKYDPNIETIDQALSKYLIETYVKERESFDFSKAEVESVNRKFNRIRNLSTLEEYRNFQLFMSKDNPISPIHYFGQNVKRDIKVDSVKFIKTEESKDFASRAKEFLLNKIPTQAMVRFTATTTIAKSELEVEDVRERFVAEINFFFEGANKDQSGNLNFVVKEYKLFKVK